MAGRATAKRATYSPGRTDIHRTSTGGTNYPVRDLTVWGVGHHLVACADVTKPEMHRWAQNLSPRPKMIYVDPPWGNGPLKSAYAKAGHSWAPEWAFLVQRVLELGAMWQCPLWIETGRRQEGHLRTLITQAGGSYEGTVPLVYGSGDSPNVVLLANFARFGYAPSPALAGLHDNVAPQAVFTDALQRGMLAVGDTVFDPCCGPNGMTAKGALANGLRFVGSELSQWSVSSVLTMLHHELNEEARSVEVVG